jgi:hypothetical protein
MNSDRLNVESDQNDANRDPISGEPGSHPLGTGVGAASAGSIGTAVGAVVGGPVGAVVGAVIGSVIGGLAGKGTAERINPTFEDNHWRENFSSRSYIDPDSKYDDYQPAYRMGYEGYDRYAHTGTAYEEIEDTLRQDYESIPNSSGLSWAKARPAVRDAWERAATTVKQ